MLETSTTMFLDAVYAKGEWPQHEASRFMVYGDLLPLRKQLLAAIIDGDNEAQEGVQGKIRHLLEPYATASHIDNEIQAAFSAWARAQQDEAVMRQLPEPTTYPLGFSNGHPPSHHRA